MIDTYKLKENEYDGLEWFGVVCLVWSLDEFSITKPVLVILLQKLGF